MTTADLARYVVMVSMVITGCTASSSRSLHPDLAGIEAAVLKSSSLRSVYHESARNGSLRVDYWPSVPLFLPGSGSKTLILKCSAGNDLQWQDLIAYRGPEEEAIRMTGNPEGISRLFMLEGIKAECELSAWRALRAAAYLDKSLDGFAVRYIHCTDEEDFFRQANRIRMIFPGEEDDTATVVGWLSNSFDRGPEPGSSEARVHILDGPCLSERIYRISNDGVLSWEDNYLRCTTAREEVLRILGREFTDPDSVFRVVEYPDISRSIRESALTELLFMGAQLVDEEGRNVRIPSGGYGPGNIDEWLDFEHAIIERVIWDRESLRLVLSAERQE